MRSESGQHESLEEPVEGHVVSVILEALGVLSMALGHVRRRQSASCRGVVTTVLGLGSTQGVYCCICLESLYGHLGAPGSLLSQRFAWTRPSCKAASLFFGSLYHGWISPV